MKFKVLTIICTVTCLLATWPAAQVQALIFHDLAVTSSVLQLAKASYIGKEKAQKLALESLGSKPSDKAVSVKLVKGGNPYYKVRIVRASGVIKTVEVDAKSGVVK